MDHRGGQVLVFFAVLLPVILLPLAAYAVDASFVSTRAAGLEEAAAQAAEAAAQQVSVRTLRSRSQLTIDVSVARTVVIRSMRVSDPAASVDSVVIVGTVVTVTAQELVALPFNFMPSPAITLHARVSARLVAGYDSPSSRLPLPTNTF